MVTSITMASSFRLSFVLLILMDLFFLFSALYSVEFIYDHVANIGPWDKNQLLFFVMFMMMLDNLHMIFVSESFWALSFQIRTGELDFVILKPGSTIFSTFFRFFRVSSCINTPIFAYYLIKYGTAVGLSPIDWVLLPFLISLAFLLLIYLEFCISTLMFYMVEGMGINFLRMQLQQLSRWPNFIFASLTRKTLTFVVPILTIGSAPVHFLYDKSKWEWLVALLISIIVFHFILVHLWRRGLSHYDSASS